MRGRITEQPVQVFRLEDGTITSPPFAEVAVGAEVDYGDPRLLSGRQYVPVMLPDGQRGYILGDSKVVRFKRVLLKADKVPVHREPDFGSPLTTALAKGTAVYLLETVDRDGRKWNRLRTPAGVEGYIEQITPVAIVPDASRAAGRQYLWAGLRWLAAALALALLGGALGLPADRMFLMGCVPLFQAVRFGVLGAWHLRAARV